ncbi:Rieske (2Fe-2S) protein [filamentous cyanobacterium CCP5]|nr:Rieske (2Fe-2S) protein [filamentous cyanobacterium CCP5]
MMVTEHPVFRRFWYPVVPLEKLRSRPQRFVLLAEPIAIWLDGDGLPAAASDRCCHRSARLSQGTVIEGCIRCPYHGWSFDRHGTCVDVPQIKTPIPATYRVPSYRCTSRYGYAWVCLEEPIADIPVIPEASDPSYRLIPEFYEPWNCAGLRLMENSFDNAHPHFVHADTFGVMQEPVPPAPDSFEETESGLRMTYVLPVKNSEVQQRNLQMRDTRTCRISEGTWYLPFLRTLKIAYPNGLVHLIFTAATPISDSSIQLVQFCLRNDSEADASAADIIAFDRAVTLEDKAILEGTDFDVPLDIKAEQHMASDRPGILMRHRLARLLKEHGEVEQRRQQNQPAPTAKILEKASIG